MVIHKGTKKSVKVVIGHFKGPKLLFIIIYLCVVIKTAIHVAACKCKT